MKTILLFLLSLCLLFTASCAKKGPAKDAEESASTQTEAPASPSSEPMHVPTNEENAEKPPFQTANPTPTASPSAHNTPISKMYIDIIKSNNYFMKAKVSGVAGVSEFAVSVSPSSTAMETESEGSLYNTVIKDGITYMIDHQNKIVITSGAVVASSASNMAADKLVADGITFVKTANGDFKGNTVQYDEYTIPGGGTMRFYFSNNALIGIESTVGSEKTQYTIEELSPGSREAMHVIPSDYQLFDMAAQGG
ncbi:MAG: hypothetical protein PUB07_04410 [Clostridia bacterium]|nr:hypothetical protein [Clostridia bacterium]